MTEINIQKPFLESLVASLTYLTRELRSCIAGGNGEMPRDRLELGLADESIRILRCLPE